MSSISFPSIAAEIKPYLQVSVDLALAGSPDASVGQAAASLVGTLTEAAALTAASATNSAAAQTTGSIINTYA